MLLSDTDQFKDWKHMYQIDSDLEPGGYWVLVDPVERGEYRVVVIDQHDRVILLDPHELGSESPRRAAERAVGRLEARF